MSQQAYAAQTMPRHQAAEGPRRPHAGNPLGALALAGACLLALAAIWSIAELVPAAQVRDALTLQDFTSLSRPRVDSIASFLLRMLEPTIFILWGTALVAFAVAREQWRVAIAVIFVMGLSPLSAEILKPLLAHAHDRVGYEHIGAASWPSGHATAAAALALSAVLVAPASIRGAVAGVAVLFVLAVSASLLILAWHMPSDVLGGWFVAAFWMSLAVAALRAAERRRPTGGRRGARGSTPAGV
jgi:membrane-associated phospholipid phosphatase